MAVHELETQSTTTPLEHDCTYENRLEWYRRNMGCRGIASANTVQRQIESIHAGGVCPPTHVGMGPTKEWEDIIDSTRI